MKLVLTLALSMLFGIASLASAQTPLGTTFTYQGQLKKGGLPYEGTADLRFRLFNAPVSGTQIGADVAQLATPVTQGVFNAALDFGAVFDGNAKWLEVSVQTPGDAAWTVLDPLQPVTPAPVAIYALSGPPNAGGGGGLWAADVYGIHNVSGNVGIGNPAHPGAKLRINVGGANGNPAWLTTANPSYAALYVQNTGANGYGFYDDQSARHYFKGWLGVNNLTPTMAVDVNGSGQFTTYGSNADPGAYSSALWVHGNTGGGVQGRVANGVTAFSTDGRAVYGVSTNNWGVTGECTLGGTYGILGEPGDGVYGYANSVGRYGGRFYNAAAGSVALRADGLAQVKTLQILGADLAESFPVKEQKVEPGTVLMIDDATDGRLRVSDEAYSKRVAGVVSGAHSLDAAVVLEGHSYDEQGRATVALTGRVWVKCDASTAAIHAGDLLTTSPNAGHAMLAGDRDRAYGATLGKAMTSLEHGTGLVLVLVNLQ